MAVALLLGVIVAAMVSGRWGVALTLLVAGGVVLGARRARIKQQRGAHKQLQRAFDALAHDLERAEQHYRSALEGPLADRARAGLALVAVLQDRLDDAEAGIAAVVSSEDPEAHGQIDVVRVLLVLRREGVPAAAALGGDLVRGTEAALRSARATQHVPELAALLRAVE